MESNILNLIVVFVILLEELERGIYMKQFEDDGVEYINNYNYELLDTHYESDGERIIEWNKYSSNVEYTDFERIAEILNIKQMRLESLMKHREEIGKLLNRIDEQQTTIQKQSERIKELENILADDVVRKSEIKDAWKKEKDKHIGWKAL